MAPWSADGGRNRLADRARQVLGGGGDAPSPCISVCRMDRDSGLCEGCWRTLEEICAWGGLDDAGRRTVWQRIERRLTAAQP
ncbi:MAG: DUF1289 domain-containing protein [Rhodoferax sp.]|nr:DUF1289 domain-containing protein [Rhodoferax sp.]